MNINLHAFTGRCEEVDRMVLFCDWLRISNALKACDPKARLEICAATCGRQDADRGEDHDQGASESFATFATNARCWPPQWFRAAWALGRATEAG